MNEQADIPVLIVGAGPTGLMLACQLAIHKIPFRIIDKNEDHTMQSRALVIQARSLEIFHQMGIAEEAIQYGKIARAVGVFINGKKVVRIPVIDIGKGLTRFSHLLMLEQSHTERILEGFLIKQGYAIDRNTELIAFTQAQDIATCVVKKNGGNEETINTKFVIGADGAHSVVREKLNIPFEGKTYQQTLFVLDCKAEVDLPDDEMYLTFAGTSFGGFFPLKNGRWRILGNIPAVLSQKEITFEDINKDFAQRVKMKVRLFDPHWLSVYHSHHRYASTFRQGRGFLVGDAAHIHSPVGAQGMNTGLQDAYNLGWKLALVLKEKAKDKLLDNYTEERIIIARNLVRTTDRVFNLLTNAKASIKLFRMHILPYALRLGGPVFQKIRFLQKFAFIRVSEIGIHYRFSSISQNASFGSFSKQAPRPGDRLPFEEYIDISGEHINIQDLTRGKFFSLFVFDEKVPEDISLIVDPFKDFISIERISLTEHTRQLYSRFGIKRNGLYLIRPDMYIAYRSNGYNADHFQKYVSQIFKNDRYSTS